LTLHEEKPIFLDAVKATASQMGLPDVYIEKDYWVHI